MITAERLKVLTNLDRHYLTGFIQAAGYKKDRFTGAKFLGITNGGQFCYLVTYVENKEIHTTKVFVTYDPTADKVSVDY